MICFIDAQFIANALFSISGKFPCTIFTTKVTVFAHVWHSMHCSYICCDRGSDNELAFILFTLFLKQSHYTSYEMDLSARTRYVWLIFFFSFSNCSVNFLWLFRLGMAGFFAVAGYGLYNFRKRNVSASVYLMQLRVAAQGTVVGTLCLGLIYSMYNQYYLKKQPAVSDTNQSHQH